MTLSEQLRTLSIFHYIVGGLHILFSSFGLIHFFLGLAFLLNPAAFQSSTASAPPFWFGLLFALMGGTIVLVGWTLGILTIIAGRCIIRRTRRTFGIIIGCINCALFPFGTVLGIFTVILLTRDETRLLYDTPPSPLNPGSPRR